MVSLLQRTLVYKISRNKIRAPLGSVELRSGSTWVALWAQPADLDLSQDDTGREGATRRGLPQVAKQNADGGGRLRALAPIRQRRSNIPVGTSLQVHKDLGMKLARKVSTELSETLGLGMIPGRALGWGGDPQGKTYAIAMYQHELCYSAGYDRNSSVTVRKHKVNHKFLTKQFERLWEIARVNPSRLFTCGP